VLLEVSLLALPAFAGGKKTETATPAELLSNRTSSLQPISLQGIRISNFGVVDGHIYRGEQPGVSDYAVLAAIGVRTVIDLRDDSLNSSAKAAKAAGLKYINIRIDGHGTPTDSQTVEFLKAVDDPANGVVYVHCAGGRHRTGSMIAIYRMVEDGWNVDKAYEEMLGYDFYTRGGHEGFKTYVFDYYRRMMDGPSSVPVVYHAPAPVAPAVAISPAVAQTAPATIHAVQSVLTADTVTSPKN
jgi:protein tyrosine/serine phosphatase